VETVQEVGGFHVPFDWQYAVVAEQEYIPQALEPVLYPVAVETDGAEVRV
jgi:hypothetical protein